ncbi:hypothetical protein FACS1894185_1980 [Betaproteobacteria bacterium]|nr:hypothetical protein FACS1894185_1980 [Betaproteobacteria bacterium]
MSFDLFLNHFEAGEPAPADRAKVLGVLREYSRVPNESGAYNVEFSDGSHVEFLAKLESEEEFTGCAFPMHGFSPLIITFVFKVAVAGEMVIFNAQGNGTPENPLCIIPAPSQLPHLPSGLGSAYTPFPCTSPEHLWQLLGMGFDDWSEYRDHVVGGR